MPRISQRAAARRTTPASLREQSEGGEDEEGGGGGRRRAARLDSLLPPPAPPASSLSLSRSYHLHVRNQERYPQRDSQEGQPWNFFKKEREEEEVKRWGWGKKEARSFDHHEHLRNLSPRPWEESETNGSGCQKSSCLRVSSRGWRWQARGGREKKRKK